MKDKAIQLFDEAREKLNEANEELFRPKEDVCSYIVCKNAQCAIENYLKGFLLHHDIDPSEYKTVDMLYDQCVDVNKKFKKINLSDFQCRSHEIDSRFCVEVTKVSNCFDVADSLDTFLKQEKII